MKPIKQYLAEQQHDFEIQRLGNAVADTVQAIAVKQLDRWCPPEYYAQAREMLNKELNEYLEKCGYFESFEQ